MNAAALLVPALRWDRETGFAPQRPVIEKAIELGAGGYIIFGGTATAVRELTSELRERTDGPLLIGADLERGAGQQFTGCTGLPPLAALGSLDDADVMRQAGAVTAREARGLGINWVYAPVMDLDSEPDNPIVGTRSIGAEAEDVARLGVAWIEGCQSAGALACAKHFPGHGRTTADSHAELPVVDTPAAVLEREDLRPFREAIAAGVASVMSAHVAFPALDPSGAPATLSEKILRGLLRSGLGFDGLIVTDALIMAGVLQNETEAHASVRALAAGCDLLLYPEDLEAVVAGIESALERGELQNEVVEGSLARRRYWAEWAELREPAASARQPLDWAREIACRVVHELRGPVPAPGEQIRLTVVDDDLGGPYPPPSREPFTARLRELGVHVSDAGDADGNRVHVVALYGDIRAWKGRPGYSADALRRVRAAVGPSREAARTVLIQFSHPRLAQQIDADVSTVCAWGGEAPMQRAAAEWLVNRCRSS
ncbi:MAG TPA: glycoside hydrolase family 3 N-terminal domain-containing protein [Gemmatimonadaceae bacterium]|nr:glycoside hydrolase family 3 N-terminal domain-containing protein [Gemmatimonadaceae bacterium]